MDVQVTAAVIGATALVGVTVAGNAISILEARKQRKEDRFFKAFEFLGGKTQVRSAGIAIVEAFHERTPSIRPALVRHLVNQLMYLETVQKEDDAAERFHEQDNVRRIAELLLEIRKFNDYDRAYKALCDAVRHRPEDRGVPVAPGTALALSLQELYDSLPRSFNPPDEGQIVWYRGDPLDAGS
jgi:hypothetical protein